MYFPGDPLFRFDPIFNSVRNPAARALLVSEFDLDSTKPDWALAYRWNIVLGHGGSGTTPLEEGHLTLPPTPSQTVGPYYTIGLCRRVENELVPPRRSRGDPR